MGLCLVITIGARGELTHELGEVIEALKLVLKEAETVVNTGGIPAKPTAGLISKKAADLLERYQERITWKPEAY